MFNLNSDIHAQDRLKNLELKNLQCSGSNE